MKGLLPRLIAFVLLALLAGCVSKSNARLQVSSAYFAGRAQGLQQAQPANPAVIRFVGPVRNSTIPWTEGMTLAEAIVTAEYISSSNPKSIFVTRNGGRIFVDPRQLLRGNDFIVQAGDVVEIIN